MKATVKFAKVTVTTEELEAVLANTPNSIGTFAQIVQLTVPKVLKKDRVTKEPVTFQLVQKMSNLNILLSTDYVRGVENQLERENKPKTAYEKGVNTMPLDLCENNNFFGYFRGNAVIQYRPYDNSRPSTKYIADGKIIDKANLGDILPAVSKAQNQGTEKEIFWRKLYVSNIRRIRINKTEYVVKN